MKIITLDDFLQQQDFYITEAKANKIFVYPTDTIYGIWAIYTPENVEKIFAIKQRDTKKIFSIIAPDFKRILNNYKWSITNDKLQEYLNSYHWVTYIFNYNRPGVRIIKHHFQKFVEKLGTPFITTSCNISWEPIITEVKNIPQDIADKVEYIIDGGTLWGKPSVLIDFVSNKIIER